MQFRLLFFCFDFENKQFYSANARNWFESLVKLSIFDDAIYFSILKFKDSLPIILRKKFFLYFFYFIILNIYIFKQFFKSIFNKKKLIIFVYQSGNYMILTLPLLKILNIYCYQWQAHPKPSLIDKILHKFLFRFIFTSTKYSLGYNLEKIIPVNTFISQSLFKENNSLQKIYDFIYVGRISNSKNIRQIINFIASLNKDYKLVLVGFKNNQNEYEEEIKKYAKKLLNKVTFVGRTKNHNLRKLYNKSKILINFSNTALDRVVLESISSGCVPVSNNINTKILLGKYNLYKSERNNLKKEIIKLISDNEYYSKTISPLQKEIEKNFSEKYVMKKIENILKNDLK